MVIRSSAEIGENLLPACHRVASLLKRWLLGTDQGAVSHEPLAYDLDEFTFRFNRRTSASRGKLFIPIGSAGYPSGACTLRAVDRTQAIAVG